MGDLECGKITVNRLVLILLTENKQKNEKMTGGKNFIRKKMTENRLIILTFEKSGYLK